MAAQDGGRLTGSALWIWQTRMGRWVANNDRMAFAPDYLVVWWGFPAD
jgi:hypothetical protein